MKTIPVVVSQNAAVKVGYVAASRSSRMAASQGGGFTASLSAISALNLPDFTTDRDAATWVKEPRLGLHWTMPAAFQVCQLVLRPGISS